MKNKDQEKFDGLLRAEESMKSAVRTFGLDLDFLEKKMMEVNRKWIRAINTFHSVICVRDL